ATDFAVERSIVDLSMTCTGPTTRPAGPGVSAATGPAAGESAATRSRPPMTWTVPVTRLRDSGRPPGGTTTSSKLTCAAAGESNAIAARRAALISTERKENLLSEVMECSPRFVSRQERRIFSEYRAGIRADRASLGEQDARSFPGGGSVANPTGRRD